ncbi:insoluble domain protein [Rhodococcus aetherivorans]|uniref:insoluble domain protein n=1 Tax=Rhodococcus aetherivorans TaxID=191292 RepID=UPI0012DEA156|nr:insoluble domain protein [Rhodococcus aetherivorans]
MAPDPAPGPAGSKDESDFWIAPPAEYNRGTQPYRGGDPGPGDDSGSGDDDYSAYADGGDHYSGDAGGGDHAGGGGGDAAPVSFGELHAPVPVTATRPIEAPRETLRLGRVLIAQPNWVCDRDVARTNNTTVVVEAQVTDLWRSVGLGTGEAERIASAQIAGGVVGAAAGAVALGVPAAAAGVLAGGTLGGVSGAALGGLVPTPIPGVPVVTTGVAGTVVGAGIGAAVVGVPAAALGAVGGGLAGVAAGTAYGAGEHGSEVEVAVPDVEHEQIVEETTAQVERWSADPAAATMVEAVRPVVTDTAPALDTQARTVVTAQPGGAHVVEQVDRVLTGVFTDTTPGLGAQLLATAVGDGLAGAAPDRKKGVHPMNLSRLKRTPARHPAVIDLLGARAHRPPFPPGSAPPVRTPARPPRDPPRCAAGPGRARAVPVPGRRP